MRLPRWLVVLAILVHRSSAVSWLLGLNGNVWEQLSFTIQVPPPPPSTVSSGPWFFWCGLQPNGGGVVQSVLTWGDSAPNGYANPNPTYTASWAMLDWTVPAVNMNGNASEISKGLWAEQSANISNVISFQNGNWTQVSRVLSGAALGLSVNTTVPASRYFHTDPTNDSNVNLFVCESELDGTQASQWDFSVTITDIYLTAKNTTGVAAACAAVKSFSDGNGFATISTPTMSDNHTCYFSSVTLAPP